MRRATQNVLLVLLGGALLKISFTGLYLRYVKPAHHWLLIVAGAVMIGLAAVSIVREMRGRRAADGGHHHPARGAWLLLLPVLGVLVVAPPALGADTVQRAGEGRAIAATNAGSTFPPLPAAGVLPMRLPAFVERAAWDSAGSLNGRAIRLTGFIAHEGGSTYVARIVIACCAADAYPAKVKLLGERVTRLSDDGWIEAVVELAPGSATKANQYIPSARVESVRPIAEPADPYDH